MANIDEFINYWGRLTPDEQEQFAYTFGMGAMQQPYDDTEFDDGLPGGIAGSQQGFQQQAMGFPVMPMGDYSNDLGLLMDPSIPTLTSKGAIDPYDLPQAASRLNYAQDIGGSMFDNAVALFAGPDAWGDPKQFEPVTTYTGDPVPMWQDDQGNPMPLMTSDIKRRDYIANGGYEGMLATLIGEKGMTPANALSTLYAYVDEDSYETASPEDKAKIEQVRATMPQLYNVDQVTGNRNMPQQLTQADYDRESLMAFATDLYDEKLTDDLASQTLMFDEKSGQYFPGRKVEDSPSTIKFRNAGLPTPNQRFDDPEYMEQAFQTITPGYQQDEAAWESSLADMQKGIDSESSWHRKAMTNEADIEKAWSSFQDDQRKAMQGRGQLTSAGSIRDPENTAAGQRNNGPLPQAPRVSYDANGNAHLITDEQAGQRRVTDAVNQLTNRFSFGLGAQRPTGQSREGQRGGMGRLNQGDVTNAGRRTAMHRDNYTRQYNERYAADQQGAPGAKERARLAGQLAGQARLGQTPLQVAMLARLASLTQRTGG